MTTFNKKELLSGLHDRVEVIRNNMQPLLRLSDEQLTRRPAAGKWCVAEIFEHLNITLGASLRAISKIMSDAPISAREVFNSGWMGNLVYNRMMPRPDGTVSKMRAPRKFHALMPIIDAREVLDTFIKQLDEFDHVLELCHYVDLQKMKFPLLFPRGLKLRLGDGLRFIVAHAERHLLQAHNAMAQCLTDNDGAGLQ